MGFDARFLGLEAAMPAVPEGDAAASVALDYLHFTVVLDTRRRFARMTGVNVDGAALVEVERGDDWRFDEPGEHLLVCHEYCGIGHHTMAGRFIVEPARTASVPGQSRSAGAGGP